jgi:thioredoxin 1
MVVKLTNENFDLEVLQYKGIVLVDFWAAWCGPCKMIGPVIEELAHEFKEKGNIKIAKLNVDESAQTAQKYNIMSIPALKFFKDGKIVDEIAGLQPKEAIIEKLNNLIVN